MTTRHTLSRRKILAGLATVGAAGAGAGLGTSAFFSDQEAFEDNEVVAGELDLLVGWQQIYYGPVAGDAVRPRDSQDGEFLNAHPDHDDDGQQSLVVDGEPVTWNDGGPTGSDFDVTDALDCTVIDEDYATDYGDDQETLVHLDDVKPGDGGQITFNLCLCDNPGFVWLTMSNYSEDGGAHPEPEAAVDSDNDPDLAAATNVYVALDENCNSRFNDEDTTVWEGTLAEARDLLADDESNGLLLDDECFDGGECTCVNVGFEVPADVGNEIQGDTVGFDLGFYTEQCRNNDTGNGGPTVPDVVSVEASPDTAGATDSVHRVEIPVGADLDGETLSTVTVDYPTDFDLGGVGASQVLGAGVERPDTSVDLVSATGTTTSDGNTALAVALDGSVGLSSGDTIFVEYRGVTNASTPDDYTVVVDVNGSEIGPGTLPITPASEVPQPVTTTFEEDHDGWQITGDAQGSASVPDHEPATGNPAPSISATDDVQGGVWYFRAPGAYLGDKSSFYGGSLSFDLMQEFSGSPSQFGSTDVELSGGGTTLTYDTDEHPGGGTSGTWTSYDITLDESDDWQVDGGGAATQADIQTVLADLTDLQIRGEYRSGSDKGYLDNVSLSP